MPLLLMCGVILLRIRDTLRGRPITINLVLTKEDIKEYRWFVQMNPILAVDTESTGFNCYTRGWRLKLFQVGNGSTAYVLPAKAERLIDWTMAQDIYWLGHNGPHDIRSIDQHLGYETGVVCGGETYIPSHHEDSRNQQEGGIGHGLKELAIARVDRNAGKWEKELKALFKTFKVPVPGEFFKSGPRKGQPKTRNARQAEGWGIVKWNDPVYVAYAGMDPILTWHVWHSYRRQVEQSEELYEFDHSIQIAADRLQRRAIRLDVDYTTRLSAAYAAKAKRAEAKALEYGCTNVNSNKQLADVLTYYGAKLTDKTKTGQLSTTNTVLRKLRKQAMEEIRAETGEKWLYIEDFITAVLLAKQCTKRREAYTEAMLRERDANDRVHPSINTLAARTTRMSVSNPALQQLPTKDRGDDES